MNSEANIFDFERHFAGTLRCIPMAVRFKLDSCGVKLSLRQWDQFTREDRSRLLMLSCGIPEEVAAYRMELMALIEARTDEVAKFIAMEAAPTWCDAGKVPVQLLNYAHALRVVPPAPEQWAELTVFQRFTLLKLTREGHDNINFIPALREFGLLSA